jgi:prenyltransferase beta subunit
MTHEYERYRTNQEFQIKMLSRVLDAKSEVYLSYLFHCQVYKGNFGELKSIDNSKS